MHCMYFIESRFACLVAGDMLHEGPFLHDDGLPGSIQQSVILYLSTIKTTQFRKHGQAASHWASFAVQPTPCC